MSKDYAKRNLNNARTSKKKRWPIEWYCAALLMGLVCLGACWGLIHKKSTIFAENTRFSAFLAQLKEIIHPPKKETSSRLDQALASSANETPEIHFNFYTELPHMKVNLSGNEESSAAPAVSQRNPVSQDSNPSTSLTDQERKLVIKETESKPHYVLQLGVFKNALDAGQMRVSLLLAGCEADVVKMTAEGGHEAYRIQHGLFLTSADAKLMQLKLQKRGIVSVIKKV